MFSPLALGWLVDMLTYFCRGVVQPPRICLESNETKSGIVQMMEPQDRLLNEDGHGPYPDDHEATIMTLIPMIPMTAPKIVMCLSPFVFIAT